MLTVLASGISAWWWWSTNSLAAAAATSPRPAGEVAPSVAQMKGQLGAPMTSWSAFLAPNDPHFSRLPAQAFKGRSARPSFRGAQARYVDYRTRLMDGFRAPPNLAGDHALVMFGCGTECVTGFLINERTGTIAQIPFANEEHLEAQIKAQADSRYLKAVWKEGDEHSLCIGQAFIVSNDQFLPYGPRLQQEPDAQSDCPKFAK